MCKRSYCIFISFIQFVRVREFKVLFYIYKYFNKNMIIFKYYILSKYMFYRIILLLKKKQYKYDNFSKLKIYV